MGESAREYTARFVYMACAGWLPFVHLMLLKALFFKLNSDEGMYFTYSAVFAAIPSLILYLMKKTNIVWLLEYVIMVKTVREQESIDRATVNVPYNEKFVLGALDIVSRGFLYQILRDFGPAHAAIIYVTSIMIVPTCTQIRYGAAGAPPKKLTIMGMGLCAYAVLMLAFMKPLYSEETYWSVGLEGNKSLTTKTQAFYTLVLCGVVNVSKLIVAARVNKSVTDEAKQLTPTEVLMSTSEVSLALLVPAFLLDLTYKNGFVWLTIPFEYGALQRVQEPFPDTERLFTVETCELLFEAMAALALAAALKITVEAKSIKKNLPWYVRAYAFTLILIIRSYDSRIRISAELALRDCTRNAYAACQ